MAGLSQVVRRVSRGKTFADAYLFARAVASKAKEIFAADGIDVIESPEHGAEGFALTHKTIRVPHVVRFHTPLFLVNEIIGKRLSVGARIVDAMERATARRATLTSSPSRALAAIVSSRFGIPLNRISVVPNCIDHETFHPSPQAHSGEPTVLYAGKVAPRKGVQVLAEAIPLIVRRVPQVRVLIIGSDHPTDTGAGSSKEEMLARLTRAGVASNVTMLPATQRTNLVRFYQNADVFVQPSLWENFATTCLEALACGIAVVASAVGGLPEIIEDGRDGLLVPPKDPVRLADAVATLLEDPARRLEMGPGREEQDLDKLHD
jgi:glycosyltransferase involved in cell wall biosynthesis